MTSLYKVHGVDYDHYLHLERFVDLFRVVKQAIYVSQKSYSIKEIEKYYAFERSGDIKKGDVSEEYYIQWMETKDKKLLEEIEEYNKQDCISTFKLRNWLLKKLNQRIQNFMSLKRIISNSGPLKKHFWNIKKNLMNLNLKINQ